MDYIEEIIKQLKQQQPLWENWYIKDKIGSGTFSVVYLVEAEMSDRKEQAALKIEAITSDGEIFSSEERKKSFLDSKKSRFASETTIMKKLRKSKNVVTYEDEVTRELYINGNFEGYYCLMRMELLTSVDKLIRNKQFELSEANVIKLAKDIGHGIKDAHDIPAIHRDIKPANMFVSESGVYKIGDFNVSKETDSARTFAGANGYMAPEIYFARANDHEPYTQKADIYSFGICLYQMMNNLLFPFEDNMLADEAHDRRLRGEPLPSPCNASPEFSKIILKACQYKPEDRYNSINDMLYDLESLNQVPEISRDNSGYSRDISNIPDYETVLAVPDDNAPDITPEYGNKSADNTVSDKNPPKKKHHVFRKLLLVIIAFLLIRHFMNRQDNDNDNDDAGSDNNTVFSDTADDENEKNYTWHIKPQYDFDEVYAYDFGYDCSQVSQLCNKSYSWFVVTKKNGRYNISDYNGKQYLTENYTSYQEHACNGIVLSKDAGDVIQNDCSEDGSPGDAQYDNMLSVRYNAEKNEISFIKGENFSHDIKSEYFVNVLDSDGNIIRYNTQYYEPSYLLSQGKLKSYIESCCSPQYTLPDSDETYNEYNKTYALVITDPEAGRYGLAKNGKITVPCEYTSYLYDGNNDIFLFEQDDKWMCYSGMDDESTKIFDYEINAVTINNTDVASDYKDYGTVSGIKAYPFYPTDGIFPIYTDEGCAYYDIENSCLLTEFGEFEEIRPVYYGLAWVKQEGKWGVIKFNDENPYELPYIQQF